jgi:PAS domain S-box-containing protein
MAEATPQMVWTAGPDGQAIYHNKRWYDFAGYAEESESDWLSIVHPDEKDRARSLWSEALHSRRVFELQCRFWDQRNETYRWHLVRAVPFDGDAQTGPHWLGTCTDIDDFKRLSEELEARVNERTEALRQSLMEKTMLLKEIHHRVKNNLQVVCSLLSMQMRNARDKSVKAPLIAAHSRALAMSLVHEQVYRSESVADLNFGEYIEMLAGQLFGAYCVDPKRIRLELNIEPISLTIEDAVPCGLILNELLSNALKHAFTDGRQGVVRVAVRRIEGDSVECSVGDDGVGLGADFEWGRGQSLGMQIVGSLVRQLRAELVASHEGGAMFRFRWKCGAGTAQGTAAWPDERQPRADPSPALGRDSAKLLSMTREGRRGTAEAN